jgi:hypothetical protein
MNTCKIEFFVVNEEKLETNKEELLRLVLHDIMSLPAYCLKKQYREIFERYAYKEFHKSVNSLSIQEYPSISDENSQQNLSLKRIYIQPTWWKIFRFSVSSLPNLDKKIFCIVIITFCLGFLSKIDNLWIRLAGLIFVLIFGYSFLIFGLRFSAWHGRINSTFSVINRVLDKIYSYADNLDNIEKLGKGRLIGKSNFICENLIEDEISSLGYSLQKINFFQIFFAFSISFIVVYLSGDGYITMIQWIANHLDFGNIEFIKKMNVGTFATFILFPIGIAISKDIVVSGLQKRNERLRQSLAIFRDRLEDRKNTV